MSAIWVNKEKIQTLWGLLHNIRIRMLENINYPGVKISGTGLKATINIDLPRSNRNGYSGPFAIEEDEEELFIYDGRDKDSEYAGYIQYNGEFIQANAELALSLDEGFLCIFAVAPEEGSESTEPMLYYDVIQTLEPPDDITTVYPLGYIEADEDLNYTIIQYHHALPQLWQTTDCKDIEQFEGSASE